MNSQTSMARTSLGPWKFALGMDGSNLRGLFISPNQEAKVNYLGMSFRSSIK